MNEHFSVFTSAIIFELGVYILVYNDLDLGGQTDYILKLIFQTNWYRPTGISFVQTVLRQLRAK